jgi:AcrR family transcriptional regulator
VATRRYDNSRRSEAADETRRRMVAAGCELARESDVRDWRGVTIAAVAERAGVSERTVYRHLGSEAGLRRAVIDEIQHQAGIDLDGLRIGAVADVAAQIFRQVAAFRGVTERELDPALQARGSGPPWPRPPPAPLPDGRPSSRRRPPPCSTSSGHPLPTSA